jgi:hypothetical protein
MSESGPSLKSRNLWGKRKAKCLAILERALLLLRFETSLPEAEVGLNRLLYFCLLRATSELYPNDDIAPVSECNNQPDIDDEVRATREQKRPDFQWIFRDKYEADPNHSSKQFVVECKRLGKPTRVDWILNRNYVNHGVCRFHDRQWAYAQRFPSGAMVGYWQSMEADEILAEVTDELRKNSLPDLVRKGNWNTCALSQLEHSFERSFNISPFQLRHLWIDLRANDLLSI